MPDTPWRAGGTDPAVSPNGRMLVMTCFSGDQQALFVSTIDPRRLHRLIPKVNGRHKEQQVTGQQADHAHFLRTPEFNTCTIRLDGTGLVHVTRIPACGPLAFRQPSFPYGRWILVRLAEERRYALNKIHLDSSCLRQNNARIPRAHSTAGAGVG